MEPQSVDVSIQDGNLIFNGKCPAKVKRAIRKRWKTDKKFREDVEKQIGKLNLSYKSELSKNA